ncbi:hypothetical protein FC093_10100 [Ilyomonas limi]|uniref:Uncharacterized protein n=1 Tax=Ilyomonas limi TaxID=2575867 RepID=A0A4U3L2L7_9BACT|nr:hypothetical protein [Ilyomonas limi]TKK68474.1 hypothetical protein FC093_10100 [Ilyomonas limi]
MDEYYSQILRQFLGEERTGSTELIDETIRIAAGIAARSQSTSRAAQRTEPVSRKERAHYSGILAVCKEDATL